MTEGETTSTLQTFPGRGSIGDDGNASMIPKRHRVFSLSRILAITSNTLIELTRLKVFYVLLVFGLLSFGQNATAQHESVASLYGYFGSTVILMVFIRLLPPYSSNRWLG